MDAIERPRPVFNEPLLRTPFHERSRALSQLDSFIVWGGYTTVDVYTSVEQEYFAIRNASTLYDLSPIAKYRIAGPDALAYLNRLVTRDVRKLKVDRVAYCVWCDDEGHVIDDGTVFRLGEREFRLCAQERQLDWLLASAIGFDVEIVDVTEEIAALALQGPTSCAVLRSFGLARVEQLKPFELERFDLAGVPLEISRTGFTGDLGYEIWMRPQDARSVWDALMAQGRSRGLRPLGSRALNIARIEAGFLQPKADYLSAGQTVRPGRACSALELGLEWLVDFQKGHFNGRRALLAQQRSGLPRQLVGLDIEGNKPAHNALMYTRRSGKRCIGHVTSAVWSPTCKRNIAFAILDAPYFRHGSEVWAEIYVNRELAWERRMCAAQIVKRPFFAPERRRATPPADH